MSSGGGGDTTTSSEPWKGQKIALNNLYNRAEGVTQGNLTPYGSMNMGGRQDATNQLWGTTGQRQAGDIANQYGMSDADFTTMQRTGVAPLNADQNAANAMIRSAAGAPQSALYGQASNALSAQLKNGNPYGQAGVDTQKYLTDLASGRASSGSLSTANSYLTDAANGKYLTADSNPYLKQMAETANRRAAEDWSTNAMPSLTAQFSNSGRYGSGAQERMAGDSASHLQQNMLDNTGNLYGQAYQSERGLQQQAAGQLGAFGEQNLARQAQAAGQLGQFADSRATSLQRAAGMAPGVAGAATQDAAMRAGLLGGVGNQMQGMQQNLYGSLAGNYGAGQQAPYNQLQAYSGIINGTPSFQNVTQQGADQGGFSAGGAMGGAAAGAAMGSMTPLGPWGTAGGAVAGGIMGGFF